MSVLKEITPLSAKDCFYIVDRRKSRFSFPIHQHEEYELNFIEGGEGVKRIVGDSVEEIGHYELTLIGGNELEHTWEQGSCTNSNIREITIQFSPTLFQGDILEKTQFSSIRRMLVLANHGITFSIHGVMMVYSMLDSLSKQQDSFDRYLLFLKILNSLAECCQTEGRVLASSSFAHVGKDADSRRISKIKSYISEHYPEQIRLEDMASIVGMTPPSFSRFFKQKTGKTVTDYILDVRIGNGARLLVDTTTGVSEICYSCGFNNLSNFNRLFKAKRGLTPSEFRDLYKKSKVIV